MRALNPSNFGRDDIIFREQIFAYHKLLRVIICMSLKTYILVVNTLHFYVYTKNTRLL